MWGAMKQQKLYLTISLLLSSSLFGCASFPQADQQLVYLPKYVANSYLTQDRIKPLAPLANDLSESVTIESTMQLTKNQQHLLALSDQMVHSLRLTESDQYNELESSLGFAVFRVHNLHLLLASGSFGEGVLFNNRDRQIRFLNIYKLNSGLGLGYQNLYVMVKITNNSKLDALMNQDETNFDTRIMFMLGFWGKQYSLAPGYSIVKTYHSGFDLGWQFGPTFFTKPQPSESVVTATDNLDDR
ncbi:MAG: hypothetical protein RLZZ293_1180 [Pseudomonadota bacterium]|jgi:hypothetical protein